MNCELPPIANLRTNKIYKQMKLFLLIAIFTIFSIDAFAQVDIPSLPKPIERSENSPLSIPREKLPNPASKNPFISRTQEPSDFPVEKKEELNMRTGNDLLTAGDFIEKKWTEDKKASEEYAADQYLGDFKTNGNFVEIYCRDYQYVDGDRVRVYVNGKMVHSSILLQANYTPVLVTLESGFNTIEFEALNQGTSGPNTASFKVIGEDGRMITSSEWNLLTGAKATMIVVKE
jgi:hypothetical protein